ncbi:hypothetical protein [Nonomuraea glycinis]|uniref:hypothetical protein n=1 Tax=Nonomuraea glycinis TaxID=2047744 RepID=UPI0033B5B136
MNPRDQWIAKRALATAHRDTARWGRLLRIAIRVPLATPIDLAHALAVRDATARPIVAKILNRYDRAQGDLLAARTTLTDPHQ